MALPEEVKEYILQTIYDAFNGDPVAFAEYLAVTKANVLLTRLQSQLTALEQELRTSSQEYSNQRNAILAQIEALLNPAP
jgi:maltooligosyltrehalose synthase